MLSLLVVTIAKSLAFMGGTPQALADSLSKLMEAPVAVMRPDAPTFGKIIIEPSNDQLFRHYIKLRSSLESPVGWEGFGPTSWPDYLVVTTFTMGIPGRKPPKDIDEPEVRAMKDGSLSVESPKYGGFMLQTLVEALPGRPLQVHPFYQRAVVAISKGPLSIEKLADCLSHAVGAKLEKLPGKRYKLNFSAIDFRRKMVARLDRLIAEGKRANDPRFELAQLQVKRDGYSQASNEQLNQAYANTDGRDTEVKISIQPQSLLGRSVDKYLSEYYKKDQSGKSIIEKVDFERPIQLVLKSNNAMRLLAYVKGGDGAMIRF